MAGITGRQQQQGAVQFVRADYVAPAKGGVAYLYDIMSNGQMKHPDCSPNDAIRALCHYLHKPSKDAT